MSLPSQWNNNGQDLLGGSLYDIQQQRDSPFSIGHDDHRPGAELPCDDALFANWRQMSTETVVSTPPSLPLDHHHQRHVVIEDQHHQTFKYLQQLKANGGTGISPCSLSKECHKDGSLFSIHSAPPIPLVGATAGGDSLPDSALNTPSRQLPSRPVSLALDPNAMLSVQFAHPVVAAHSSNAVDPPGSINDEADDEENENLWTVSSLTAKPLIAKSKELRSIRFIAKSQKPGARTKTGKSSGSSAGKGSSDDGTSVGGVSKSSGSEDSLDGGYGWLVVFGAFSVQFWVAGLVKSYGVLYVEIMESFPNSSASLASWIPAILSALCLVLAPVSSVLCQRFSCRRVVFIGGLFCALGLTLSYFATKLIHLFFSFGVLTGIGGGLSTTPGIIIVSQYFDKRRALANGICVSGTAAGSFVFPMLIDRLVRSFGFHGTILILGICMLQVCASALLYRPPVFDSEAAEDADNQSCHLKSVDTTQTLVSQNSSVLGTYLSASAEEPLNSCTVGTGKKIFIENLFLEETKNRLNELCQTNKLAPDTSKQEGSDDEGKDFLGETIVMKPFAKCMRSSVYLHSVEDLSTDSTFVYKKRGSGYESNRGSRKRNKHTPGPVTSTEDSVPKHHHVSEKKDSVPSADQVVAEEERPVLSRMIKQENEQNSTGGQLPAPINRGLSKSMMIIPTPVSELIADDEETSSLSAPKKGSMVDDDDEDEDGDDTTANGCVDWINCYLDLSLLSDPIFILMTISVILMSTGSPYMLYYLPAYVLSAGYTKADAGYLVAISAAFDLTGRLGFGYLSDLQLFDRRKAFVVCIMGAGLAVLLLSIAESSFYTLAAAAGTYGFCLGSWYLLMPVLLADVFQPERISSSYGLIRMFQGVGAISIPPLAGFLRDLTGGYEICFYCMGACMTLGCIPVISIILSKPDDEDSDGEEADRKVVRSASN